MSAREGPETIFESLQKKGMEEVEVYRKSGRSRRFEIGFAGKAGSSSIEQGWAIRAGTPRSSLFLAGTGLPSARSRWPEPDGQPLRLPTAVSVPPWRPPTDLDAALVAESEAMALLTGIETALAREVEGSRLLLAVLEEGTSETSIANTRGVDASFRSRAASLFVEAVGPWPGAASAVLSMAQRDHRAFRPVNIASRLANRLMLTQQGAAPARERGDVLVGAAVGARLLASLQPLLLGPKAAELARRLRDRQGKLGGALLTIVDDGRLPGGVLEAPVDGEGLPTGPVTLVEEGHFRQALEDRSGAAGSRLPWGCARRESWRDLPTTSPSHLYVQPQADVAVGDLLGAIARGYYLLEPLGSGVFDFERDHFRIPVCGFVLRQGQATAPLSRVWLEGGISALLRNIQAVARDLSFQPLGAMIGAPTMLISGLGLRGVE